MKNVLVLVHDDAGQASRFQAALDVIRAIRGVGAFVSSKGGTIEGTVSVAANKTPLPQNASCSSFAASVSATSLFAEARRWSRLTAFLVCNSPKS